MKQMALALMLLLSGCVSGSYMGIPLTTGNADPAIQELAVRARGGDKQAQLDLGIRFEEGNGVTWNPKVARRLYTMASYTSGRMQNLYVPNAKGSIATIPVYTGRSTFVPSEAVKRLSRLRQYPYANEKNDPLTLNDLALIDTAFEACVAAGVTVKSPTLDTEDLTGRGGNSIYPMRKCIGQLIKNKNIDKNHLYIASCNFSLIESADRRMMSEQSMSIDELIDRYNIGIICRNLRNGVKITADSGDYIDLKSFEKIMKLNISDVVKMSRYGVVLYGVDAEHFLATLCRTSVLKFSPGGVAVDALEERICIAWRPISARIRGRRF